MQIGELNHDRPGDVVVRIAYEAPENPSHPAALILVLNLTDGHIQTTECLIHPLHRLDNLLSNLTFHLGSPDVVHAVTLKDIPPAGTRFRSPRPAGSR
jgi:hypothetical protein